MKISVLCLLKQVYGAHTRKGISKLACQHPADVLENSFLEYLESNDKKARIYKCCLLHDILEDSQYSEEDLYEMINIEQDEMNLLKLLSKKIPNEDGTDYLEGILQNEEALIIKLADRIANLKDLTRWIMLAGLRPELVEIIQQYITKNQETYQRIQEKYPQYLEKEKDPKHPFHYQLPQIKELMDRLYNIAASQTDSTVAS